ncbi:MAG: DUF4382 domain-containing protein, partial [Bryobacteraceae bacterium]
MGGFVFLMFRTTHAACRQFRRVALLAAFASAWALGCSNSGSPGGFSNTGSGGGGASNLSITVTDTPPAGVTILSFEFTVTGATLTPATGNPVTLISSSNPVRIELKRLEGDATLLTSSSVAAGTYTSLMISVANPSFTFLNTSGAPITVGTTVCPSGAACQVQPATAANITLSGSPFPLGLTSSSPSALQLDFNLNNILSPALALDFNAGLSATALAAPSSGVVAPMEDLVGQVTALDIAHNTFTLSTAQSALKMNVDINTAFLDFLGNGCSSHSIGCLIANQVLAVDASLMGDGSLLAKNVTFEDAHVDEPLIEGVIFAVDS